MTGSCNSTLPVFRKRHIQKSSRQAESASNRQKDSPAAGQDTEQKRTDLAKQAIQNHSRPVSEDDDDDSAKISLTALQKLRKSTRARKAGVEFTAQPTSQPDNNSEAAPKRDETEVERLSALEAWNHKFAVQGARMKEDMNRHMEAFIDRHLGIGEPLLQDDPDGTNEQAQRREPLSQLGAAVPLARVEEVELGTDSRQTNIERTREALRRKAEQDQDDLRNISGTHTDTSQRGGKSNIKNKEDLLRDRIVDQILSDAKIMRYDYSSTPKESRQGGAHQSADDRMAEQFRREFFDNQADRISRRPRHPPKPRTGPGAKPTRAKGPRLGGSRTARAAARRTMNEGK